MNNKKWLSLTTYSHFEQNVALARAMASSGENVGLAREIDGSQELAVLVGGGFQMSGSSEPRPALALGSFYARAWRLRRSCEPHLGAL